MNSNNDLAKLIENLPVFLQNHLNQHPYKDQLIEIVLDLESRLSNTLSPSFKSRVSRNSFGITKRPLVSSFIIEFIFYLRGNFVGICDICI